jgi:hypothetical protein
MSCASENDRAITLPFGRNRPAERISAFASSVVNALRGGALSHLQGRGFPVACRTSERCLRAISPALESTIIGEFDTRRDAELAVEHVVQDCGIPRSDVFIQPLGRDASSRRRCQGNTDARAASEFERLDRGFGEFPWTRPGTDRRRPEQRWREGCPD